MPELGNKHECYNCGAKFYDLGKSDVTCPKCGANQKNARQADTSAEAAAARRKRRDDILRTEEVEEEVVPEIEPELVDVALDEEDEVEDDTFEDAE